MPAAQYTSLRYGKRLAELGAQPSIGSVGDTFDNALAESVNGLYKTELIRGPDHQGPWRTVDDVRTREHSAGSTGTTPNVSTATDDVPPTEFETAFYAAQQPDQHTVGIKQPESLQEAQGDSCSSGGLPRYTSKHNGIA